MWIFIIFLLCEVARCQYGNNYSGYINVNATTNHNLFYWAFESQNSISDPVVLWLNGVIRLLSFGFIHFSGGPGASSIFFGLLNENGCVEERTSQDYFDRLAFCSLRDPSHSIRT
jgi:hypothetical protein